MIFGMLHGVTIIQELKHDNPKGEYIQPIREVNSLLRKGLRRGIGQRSARPEVYTRGKITFLADLRVIGLPEVDELDLSIAEQDVGGFQVQVAYLSISDGIVPCGL